MKTHFFPGRILLWSMLGWLSAVAGPALAADPDIAVQPASQIIFLGDPVTFSVVPSGTAPFTYEWLRNSLTIGNATSSSYSIPATTLLDNNVEFSVVVRNASGSITSAPALLRIDEGVLTTNTITLLPLNAIWRYNQNNVDLGTAWKDFSYVDSTWPSGPGLLDGKTTPRNTIPNGEAVGTQLSLGASPAVNDITTYYLRAHFQFTNAGVVSLALHGNFLIDDGAAFYLNGAEVGRIGVNPGALFSDWSNRTVGDPCPCWEPLDFAASLLPGENVLAVELHQCNLTSSDITLGCVLTADVVSRIQDTTAPTVLSTTPTENTTVRAMDRMTVRFSEAVEGVDPADLLINGVPATDATFFGQDTVMFVFPPPATGAVQFAWAPAHGIHDLAMDPNYFVGTSFSVIFDPNARVDVIRINEILASNKHGIRDEDGEYSDWIELYNFSSLAVSMAGWSLTDDPLVLNKWVFPNTPIPARGYLLVWASGKNRATAGAPLHTNFKLDRTGDYLALVMPDGGVTSVFSPAYPVQYDDISYGCDPIDPTVFGYFATPTPRAANVNRGSDVGPEIVFSRDSGTFTAPFNLSLSLSTASTNYEIRYFLVTNATTAALTNITVASMQLYTGPIPVNKTIQVRARAVALPSGVFPGPLKSETYIMLSSNAAAFSSDVPIVLMHNFGGLGPAAEFTAAGAVGVMMVFDTNNASARSSLTNPPVVATRIGSHIRGSSTAGFPKKSLAVEAWTEINFDDNDIPMPGMPADSDWAFYAPNFFDQVLIKNSWIHEVSRTLVGRYSARTRFAEVFLNTAGGQIAYSPTSTGTSMGDYYGLHVIEEKIKRNKDRVQGEPLTPELTTQPAASGSYVLKIDRGGDPDDINGFASPTGFSFAGQSIYFVDPDGRQVVVPQQRDYLVSYIRSFETALRSANYTNPVTGYAAWMDVDSWIDNHILNTLPFNIDGYRLSGFFYKDRTNGAAGGKLQQGPLWDFDRTQGCGGPPNNDNRAFSPRLWRVQATGDQGTDLFGNPGVNMLGVEWWWRLFSDIDFWQKWVDRYQTLRRTTLTVNNLGAITDRMGLELRESQAREVKRWGGNGNSDTRPRSGTVNANGYSGSFNGTYQGELDFHKKWVSDRLNFMDTNFLAPPVFSRNQGQVPSGTTLTITPSTLEANSSIIYTLDGTDPRLPGGGMSPTALSNRGPVTITISDNIRVFARNWNSSHANLTNYPGAVGGNPRLSTPWSGPTIGTFYTQLPPLRITEIMYHPGQLTPGDTNDPGAYEYIELSNISGNTLNLVGFTFTNGISFTFTPTSAITSIEAGGRIILVKNQDAFLARFPSMAGSIAGEYTGSLNNSGERIALIGPMGEPILDFSYDQNWYPGTDGFGFSLVTVDENATPNTWTNINQWRASTYDGGSPAAPDAPPVLTWPVIVNEILTATSPDDDAVELFNPNSTAVDISYWWLTDNRDIAKKYLIPPGTSIPAYGFVTIYETNGFGVTGLNALGRTNYTFGLSSYGEEVYLFSGDDAGRLTGYYQGFDFGPADPMVTFGRYVNSIGVTYYVAQSVNTPAATNAYPRVGPVVISEIMCEPPPLFVDGAPTENFRDEYVELRNITSQPVPLYDPAHASNRWILDKAVNYTFPENYILPANGYLLVVGFDPVLEPASLAAFRSRYSVAAGVPILGPFSGRLENSGERLELRKPGALNPGGLPSMILIDRVDYATTNPWPVTVNGTGASLQRLDVAGFANDPANWTGAGPSAGRDRNPGVAPTITVHPQPQTVIEEGAATFAVTVTGTEPFIFQWLLNGIPLDGGYSTSLVLTNIQLSQAGTYSVSVLSDSGSAVSSNALLTVRPLPVILQQPVGTNVGAGSNIVLQVSAQGTGTITYRWQFNGADIPFATGSIYSVAQADTSDSGVYRVLVTDSVGTRTSEDVVVNVMIKPAILTPPASQTVGVGQRLDLTVVATGSEPLYYRWRKAATTYSAFGEPTLSFANVVLTNAAYYDVVITNLATAIWKVSPIVSPKAYVTVVDPPNDQSAMAGTDVSFQAVLAASTSNAWSFLYQGTTLLAGTNTTASPKMFTNVLTLTNVTAEQVGSYTFFITNNFGASASFTFQLQLQGDQVRLSNPLASSDGSFNFLFQIQGKDNGTYNIQTSPDLTNWTQLGVLPITNAVMQYLDAPDTNSTPRFYRVLWSQ